MRTKAYTNKFFISEVQKAYLATGQRPQMRQFSWSTTAHRRFGSWNELLKRAGVVRELTPSEVEELTREKAYLWQKILHVTYDPEWYLDTEKEEETKQLRTAIEAINRELSE